MAHILTITWFSVIGVSVATLGMWLFTTLGRKRRTLNIQNDQTLRWQCAALTAYALIASQYVTATMLMYTQ